jgi:hypothetical protein
MSLINDALKRAKQAQQQAPPPAELELQFRPADPAAESAPGPGLSIVAVLVTVAIFGGIGFWYFSGPKSPARARSVPTESPTAPADANASRGEVSASPAEFPAKAAHVSETSVASPAETAGASPVAVVTQPAIPATSTEPASSATNSQSVAGTNGTAVAQPSPPQPAPLKLQGIVFNPKRPSAVINGKSLFRGDRIGAFRVLAIGPDSVTLVGGGRTNVLTLPD